VLEGVAKALERAPTQALRRIALSFYQPRLWNVWKAGKAPLHFNCS